MSESGAEATPTWFRRGVWYTIFALLVTAAALWLLSRVTGLILALLLAVFVSFALEPAVQYLAGRGWKRGAATGVVFVVSAVIVIAFIAVMVPAIIDQGTAIAADLPDYVNEVTHFLDDWLEVDLSQTMFVEVTPDLQSPGVRLRPGFQAPAHRLGPAGRRHHRVNRRLVRLLFGGRGAEVQASGSARLHSRPAT